MIKYHPSGNAMARVLVQYIPDDKRIQRIVHAEFGSCLLLRSVRELRRACEKPIKNFPYLKGQDAFDEVAMDSANREFVQRLHQSHPYVFDAAEQAGRMVVRP